MGLEIPCLGLHGTQPEAGMHRLQGSDAIGFRHHAAGADLTGGDQFDARPGLVLMSTKVRRYLISIEKPMKPGQRG